MFYFGPNDPYLSEPHGALAAVIRLQTNRDSGGPGWRAHQPEHDLLHACFPELQLELEVRPTAGATRRSCVCTALADKGLHALVER